VELILKFALGAGLTALVVVPAAVVLRIGLWVYDRRQGRRLDKSGDTR
jgi:hypothetical protein